MEVFSKYFCDSQGRSRSEFSCAMMEFMDSICPDASPEVKNFVSYLCSLCNFRSRQLSCIRKHQDEHQDNAYCYPAVLQYSGGTIKTLSDNYVRKTIAEKPFACSLCEYRCSQQIHLKNHEKRHTGEKPFVCRFCDYRCAQAGNLKNHEKKHTGEKPYECQYCNYRCAQLGNLNNHTRKHTGEKPYSCSYCGYRCSQLGNLKNHERKHTGEKPFSCPHCDYKCIQLGSLKKHEKKHLEKSTNTEAMEEDSNISDEPINLEKI